MKTKSVLVRTTIPNTLATRFRTACATKLLRFLLLPAALYALPLVALGGSLLQTYFPMSDGVTKSYTGDFNSTTYHETESFTSDPSCHGQAYDLIYSGDCGDATFILSYVGDALVMYGFSGMGETINFDTPLAVMDEQTVTSGGTDTGTTTASVSGGTVTIGLSATVSPAGTVTVPAGTFSNCKSLSLSMSANGTSASANVWVLAPSIGIIEDAVCSYNGSTFTILGYMQLDSVPTTVQFIDPYPLLLDASGNVVSDPDQLATLGRTVTGAAADGVTPVLIRVAGSSTPVTFSLASGSAADGGLTEVGGTGPGSTSVTVPPQLSGGASWAFAIYWAPVDFGTLTSSRTIQFQISGSFGTTNMSFQLVPPPVVLVHGLWSEPIATWVNSGFENYLLQAGYKVFLADYGAHNANSFDPSLPIINNWPANAVRVAIANAIAADRANGIALSQVDVVGHSMGGLAARAYAQYPEYFDSANHMQGYIHKLITIGTPHYGSCLANFLVNHSGGLILDTRSWHYWTLAQAFDSAGHPIDEGGVADLQVNSTALQTLTNSPFVGSAIVGSKVNSCSASSFDPIIGWFCWYYTVDTLLGDPNDTIVNAPSQRGGLTVGLQTTEIAGIVHASQCAADIDETHSLDVESSVVQLLATPMYSGKFDSFQPPSDFFQTGANAQCSDCQSPPSQSARYLAPAQGATNNMPGVMLSSPTNGTTFLPGDEITLAAIATNGVQLTNAVFMIEHGPIIPAGNPLFVTTFIIPSDFIGSKNVVVLAADGSGNLYRDSATINVQPTARLISIQISPGSVLMSYGGEQEPLLITGNYSDGVLRDITSGSAGTTYSTQSGSNAVVSVTTDGMLTEMGNGQDLIIVSNGLLSASVPVQVQISSAPVCAYVLSTTNVTLTANGGSGSFTVTAGSGCSWNASSDASWLHTSSSGSGNGTVNYNCDANTSTGSRTGHITVGGQTFTVTQSGASVQICTYTLKAMSITLPAKGGSKTVKVKASGGNCSWIAVSNDSFITITETTTAAVKFTVPGNTNTVPLSGTMTIAGQTFTVNQAAGGCTFKLSPKVGKIKATGGIKTVKVKPNFSDCAWTAVSNDSFITITDGASGSGKGTVSYTVDPNTNTTALTGSITIGDQMFTVIQAAAK